MYAKSTHIMMECSRNLKGISRNKKRVEVSEKNMDFPASRDRMEEMLCMKSPIHHIYNGI